MAKFIMEDGSIMSGDRYMDKLKYKSSVPDIHHVTYYQEDIEKLKKPVGANNRERISNICTYDLLVHIQQKMILANRCVLDIITNGCHNCVKHNDMITERIRHFANNHITPDIMKSYPKHDDEDNDEYNERLCHIIMQRYHPRKLQMIQCEECIQQWMNSDKW